jgi:hypothetical protein
MIFAAIKDTFNFTDIKSAIMPAVIFCMFFCGVILYQGANGKFKDTRNYTFMKISILVAFVGSPIAGAVMAVFSSLIFLLFAPKLLLASYAVYYAFMLLTFIISMVSTIFFFAKAYSESRDK